MKDIVRLLDQISYKELTRICGEEELQKSGKKVEIIKRLAENLPEEKLRKYIMEFMGVGAKIVDHDRVPEHRKLNPDELKVLLEKHGIKKWQLPKIFDKDPISMLIGARPGDVLEISRKSETAGETKYYRLVIRGSG